MFSSREIRCPHAGQAEGGWTRLNRGRSPERVLSPMISVHSARHAVSIMRGSRQATTLMKLPAARPRRIIATTNASGIAIATGPQAARVCRAPSTIFPAATSTPTVSPGENSPASTA